MTDERNAKLQQARSITRQYFGRTIALYVPLYISNYCDNHCVYCGFNAERNIKREKLAVSEIKTECRIIAKTGIQNILILTGESRVHTPISYLKEAVVAAKKYFPNIALEVYPMEEEEYRELYLAGVDGVTIYQETYDRERYKSLHLSGKKQDYEYRYNAPARIAQAGIRHISLGALLGLAAWKEDVSSLFRHLRQLEKKHPGVEFSLSFPRIQKIAGNAFSYQQVGDKEMFDIVSTARLSFPRVGINLSTRETPAFRDAILEYGITKMSAGSSTRVGGYGCARGEKQFDIQDERPVKEIKNMLISKGYDPVLTDWRSIGNECV